MSDNKYRLHPHRLGMRGVLLRQMKATKAWREKYFVLEKRRLKCYSNNSMAEVNSEFLVDNDLQVYDVPDGSVDRNFVIYLVGTNANRKTDAIIVAAANEAEKQQWIEALSDGAHNGFKRIFQPDIWSSAFFPSIELLVYYRNKSIAVENGNSIRPLFTEEKPIVELEGAKEDEIFTLLLIDIDPPQPEKINLFNITAATSTSETTAKEQIVNLQWMIINGIGPNLHSSKEVIII